MLDSDPLEVCPLFFFWLLLSRSSPSNSGGTFYILSMRCGGNIATTATNASNLILDILR